MYKAAKSFTKKIKAVIRGDKNEKDGKKKTKRSSTSSIDGLPELTVSSPSLTRSMSNSEKRLDYVEGFHVNANAKYAVNLATPGQPDHTFSAVGFNVHALPKGAMVKINGFSVGGELERLRIFVILGEMCHTYRTDKTAWTCVYDKLHRSAMRRNIDVWLDEPINLGPEQTCAFYIHSNRMNDRGLKYRSCRKGVCYVDDNIAITRGFAHTSPTPFDPSRGWFRENRVLSGSIHYEVIPILWTNFCHCSFPVAFQHAVIVVRHVLCEELWWNDQIVDTVIEYFPFDWFGTDTSHDQFLKNVSKKIGKAKVSRWDYEW